MEHLIEVSFKGNRREFYTWEGEHAPPAGAGVVVEADRGEDLGRVHSLGELAAKRVAGVPHAPPEGTAPRKALRLATADDVARGAELDALNETARRKAAERVRANGLVMKLTDAEWQWDRKKLTFYFTAEKRVDFRNLVRDLASIFRARIELKQIGVRDEARRLDGIGRCGRQLCSSSWLPELRPVNLGVAKDQRLSLNPSQISGACGRLMCCLRYEHDFYVQSRKRFPKEGKILPTSKGEEKVTAIDIFRETVSLRTAEGEPRVIPLAELRREMAEASGDVAGALALAEAVDLSESEADSSSEEGEARTPRGEREASRRPPVGRPSPDRAPSARPEREPRLDRAPHPERPLRAPRSATPAPTRAVAEPPVPAAAAPFAPTIHVAPDDAATAEPTIEPTSAALPDENAVPAARIADVAAPVELPAASGADDADTPDDATESGGDGAAGEGEAGRARRRRGRRGGRRGRGGPTNTSGE